MIKSIHPQLQQFINLFLLLIIGKYVADMYLTWESIFGILLFAFFIDHFFYYIRNKTLTFISFSSLSTSIGVVLMMVSTHYYVYLVVIFLALLQKQFLHFHGKHFFNPSNFALLTGLLFFYEDAHLVLGQLGDERWIILVIMFFALSILYRVDRWVIPVGFTLFYILFQYVIIVHSDPVFIMEDIYHRFYSVSFIVFILFMLTDPKTTPSNIWYQIGFVSTIAFLTTLLDYFYGFRVQHLFVVLFFCSPWIVLLEAYPKVSEKKKLLFISLMILFLALSAIIYIQMQPPYYFEMDT